MSAVVSATDVRRSRVRLFIVTMLFLVTTVNYADRATLSIAGPALSKELHLDPVAMGWIFSAFGWSYVVAQVPGGWLLDRYGSRLVYAFSIIVWSLFTLMQGWVGFLSAGAAIAGGRPQIVRAQMGVSGGSVPSCGTRKGDVFIVDLNRVAGGIGRNFPELDIVVVPVGIVDLAEAKPAAIINGAVSCAVIGMVHKNRAVND